MADCLYQFHTVGWLHKGVCNQNIIFFQQPPSDPSSAFLIGFQLARPDMIDESSIKSHFDPFQGIHRFPQAQSAVRSSRYCGSYDLYRLALVFFEIITWKPVEQIVGIDDLKSAKPRDLQAIRNHLTKQDRYLQSIQRAAGDAVNDIMKSCLCADMTEKPLATGENNSSIEVRLQRIMGRDTICRLQNIARVLASIDQEEELAIS